MANSVSSPVRLVRITSLDQLTPQRLAQGADAGADAFAPDALFRWMRPNRTPNWDERHREYFEDRLRHVAHRQGKDHLVMAIRGGDDGKDNEDVLGWAIWDRVLSPEEMINGDFFWGRVAATGDESSAPPKRDPDPAEDPSRVAAFSACWAQVEKDMDRMLRSKAPPELSPRAMLLDGTTMGAEARFPRIKLYLIAVSPKFQRQGIGKMLLEWGMHEADKQGVPIVMGASPIGEGLYRKCGFDDLGVRAIYASEEDEAIYGRLNDGILVRWPRKSSS